VENLREEQGKCGTGEEVRRSALILLKVEMKLRSGELGRWGTEE
jgi:hypothetical protein